MHCTDVEFLENNVTGAVFGDASTTGEANGVYSPPAYPHRLTLLRPELLEQYRESQLEQWIDTKVKEHRARLEEEGKSVESELKEAATDAVAAPASATPAAKPAPAVIQASDFKLAFNPDAFVERKDGLVIYDPEEASTKAVRDASRYLREKVLPEFVVMVLATTVAITDGQFLAKLLHRRGINIRYLGMLADVAERQGPTLEYPAGTTKPDIAFGLASLKVGFLCS